MKNATGADRAFWDSSGLVLLCANQRSTAIARRIRVQTGMMAIWWGTPVEVASAFHRLHRERHLVSAELATALRRLSAISEAALEVAPTESVRALAASLLREHDLRAGDALQLAAALVLCQEHPRNRAFICFDAKLAAAADTVGFTVLPAT